MSDRHAPFFGARQKLSLGSLDDAKLHIHAQYNPAQLDRQKQATWNHHETHGGAAQLEYTGQPPRTLALDLLFDGFETKLSVEDTVAVIEELASPRKPGASDPKLRRAHFCVVTWGDHGLPPFRCVIDSIATKYTMFDRDGVPVRASCSIKLTEASLRAEPCRCDGGKRCPHKRLPRFTSEMPRDLAGLASRNRNR